MSSSGRSKFQLAYQISPILLTNGIAQDVAGGGMPIISLTDGDGGLSSVSDQALNDYFAQYDVISGGTLIDQDIGHYPFANQQVAANAVITKPLTISVRMVCPVQQDGGYGQKAAIMTSLQSSLSQHNNLGGTYTIVTPFFTYPDCLMTGMRDISDGETKQRQWQWQLDFEQPLLTLQQAQQAYSALMQKLSSGGAVAGDPPAWSGVDPVTGNPSTLAAPSVVPSASGLPAAGASSPAPNPPVSV